MTDSSRSEINVNMDNIAGFVDHTNLHPDASQKDIEKLCKEALQWKTASVCVNPHYVSLCDQLLEGSSVEVCTVIGFPLGANLSAVKAFEAEQALADGADELDMVMNIGALKSGQEKVVLEDIQAVKNAVQDKILKVILETALLNKDEIIKSCQLACDAGADFVKTSTGFADQGATVENVKLMYKTVAGRARVKAAGGIRNYETALKMIKAGASRIGASSTAQIVAGPGQ